MFFKWNAISERDGTPYKRARRSRSTSPSAAQADLRQAPRTRPLIDQATNGRPISIKTSGHGFVSNAEKSAIVANSVNNKLDQKNKAIRKTAIEQCACIR